MEKITTRPTISMYRWCKISARTLSAAFIATALWISPLNGSAPVSAPYKLKALSLDELTDVKIVSVSRHEERLGEVASAIQVIGQNQIRRFGVETIPQALRLASNLQVAQASSSAWRIGARGFNSTASTSNKLLVMIDGRSVYSPLFSGTFWDSQDVFLPDVERIEVISGPGGTMWGANAVNGVINILTKSSRDTQGVHFYVGGGTTERALTGVRSGGKIGENTYFRIYAKYSDYDDSLLPDGTDAGDKWNFAQTGFRMDSHPDSDTQLTFQGDFYRGRIEQLTAGDGELDGGNLLGRWQRNIGYDGKLQLQVYYDIAMRDAPNTFGDRLETLDVDAQHDFVVADRHHISWGLHYRIWWDDVRNRPDQAFIPASDKIQLGGIFAQDEIRLFANQLRLTIGAKLEYNDYSGADFQPGIRAAWLLHPDHTLWTAVSRAVRTPSRFDRDFYTPPQPPYLVGGGKQFESEVVLAWEAGWRGKVSEQFFITASLFYNDYDNLRSLEPTSPPPVYVPLVLANGVEGESHGIELTVNCEMTSRWRWHLGYTLMQKDLRPKSGSFDINQARSEISDPDWQFQIRTSVDITPELELNVALRHVDEVPVRAGGVDGTVPSYTELDLRLGWHVRENVEISLTGRNLLHDQHAEAGAAGSRREIRRSLYAKVVWRY